MKGASFTPIALTESGLTARKQEHMTEITETMIERGIKELEDWACWMPQAEPRRGTTRQAVICILTAALASYEPEEQEKNAMRHEADIENVPVRIWGDLNVLKIGGAQNGYLFSRETAPELVAFIQQWLDHDSEEELADHIHYLRSCPCDECKSDEEIDKQIIQAVRDHDAKYGKE